ncbi:BTAD domain-containing putative transcriptional regulator [Amycolatopsis sp. H20-H5]|uniref:BTAD domain-containing putative transcriptional regulator n=1 Tax=Amycolatopsis sp. H20-H5 TaxID=3046309 RepID=UPI002DBBA061|nr:BTAD domain-containing putative transcriptional regulator [Amycolatopsis sp. H20-H5]MEC3980528.1 BTAD domain-containing putative transcriptional regulator [Amycolatopsis sp. H20-H5]
MRFGVLGATEVRRADGTAITIGGPRSRALLALLALEAGRVVPAQRLIDGLYGEHPPEGAANALQSQVSRLRQALKDVAPVEFTAAGYRLAAEPGDVDVHRFEWLADEGRRALSAGEHAQAGKLLRDALALWRGPAFADLTDAPFAASQATRLEELRLTAAEDRIETELATGRAADVVAELREIVTAQPLRERPRAQLVRALHHTGRGADALAAFEDARRVLAEELGADPGAELAQAHLTALRGEPQPLAVVTLPAQLTSFVGRDDELRQVAGLLANGRLVTLTGPGGTGKTRLAIEAATAERGERAFVELAPHGDGAEVAPAVIAALGLRAATTNRAVPGGVAQDPAERLVAALADRSTLLVLDNCEHVVEAAARLAARLLAACPGLRILATSREPLGVPGERLSPVPRLAVPPPGTPAGPSLDFAGVRLFADRASASDPSFLVDETTIGDVQHICAALDGLPLAIELAAARVRALPVGEIAARLDDRFRLLSRGSRTAETRHRTLRGVVEWSWDLLGDEERVLARRLTVFAGGATLAAAGRVTGVGDTVGVLAGLVDKSLVELAGDRYRMLETIAAFCAERLDDAHETEQLRRAHAEHFVRLTEEADPKLRTAEQLKWLDTVDAEYDNVLAALRWATGADVPLALRLIASLATYWWMRGRRFEGAMLSLELVKRLHGSPPEELLDEFLLCLLIAMSAAPEDEALKPYRSLTERYATDWSWTTRLPALHLLFSLVVGPPEDDSPLYLRQTAIMNQADPWTAALIHTGGGLRAMLAGDLAGAEEGLRAGEARFRALGERWGLAMSLDHLSEVLGWRGAPEALGLMDEALLLMRELGATDETTDLLCRRADRRARLGELAGARADYELSVDLARRSGMPEARAAGYVGLAQLARWEGDLATARLLSERALAECRLGAFSTEGARASALVSLGWVAGAEGATGEAARLHRQALESSYRWHASTEVANALEGLAGVAQLDGEAERAAMLLGAGAAVRGMALAVDPDVARVRSAARALIGDEAFDRAYGLGLAMTTTKALTTAGVTLPSG